MASLEYNGYTGLTRVQITEWSSDPILAPDGVSHESTQHRVRGTAVIAMGSFAAFTDEIQKARRLLSVPRASFIIATGAPSGTPEWRDEGDEPASQRGSELSIVDNYDSQRARFSITDVANGLAALVDFEIEWRDLELLPGADLNDVLSHTWTQQWEMGENGMFIYRVIGQIRILASADPTPGSSWTDGDQRTTEGYPTQFNYGSNPDAYRPIILPELPCGFRTTRMDFIVDDAHLRMTYIIEMKQMARELPAPAKRGRADFNWRKSIENKQMLIGQKTVAIELEGGPEASPADLLGAAVLMASQFIHFDVTDTRGADMIRSVEFNQPDAFNRNVVQFKIHAWATSDVNAEEGGFGPDELPDPAIQLMEMGLAFKEAIQNNTVPGLANVTFYVPPIPYAFRDPIINSLYRSIKRSIYSQPSGGPFDVPSEEGDSLPIAAIETLTDANEVSTQVYCATSAQYSKFIEALFPNSGSTSKSTDHERNKYIFSEAKEHVFVADTGMRVMPSRLRATPDAVFQMTRPVVMVRSEINSIRHEYPPGRQLMKIPSGAMILQEEFVVSPGFTDAQNRRLYAARHTCLCQVTDIQEFQPTNGFRNQVTTYYSPTEQVNVTLRSFWPQQGSMRLPWRPEMEEPKDPIARTVFGAPDLVPAEGSGNPADNYDSIPMDLSGASHGLGAGDNEPVSHYLNSGANIP